ncbi:hypothetical protein GE300_15300 [Rhodobacteraceae bacterium 2CG4]|uniref:Uncharacterized protein n=1 Tax=Halovulum marinum TaxID=2662447 RepID=A0A6L5Z3S7_9RHOB|nr:hypothetical protein [Halovulum marinum]
MALALAFGLAGSAAVANSEVDLDAMRAATEKYRDVEMALADGFIRDPSDSCVSAEAEGLPAEWGAMGVHYIHPARLKIKQGTERVDGDSTNTEFMEPSILLYEPQADGSMELVAVENLVWIAAWEAAGNADAPMTNGRVWDTMMDDPATEADEAHGFEPHYDQHFWAFRDNPAGELMPFNASVSCEHHGGS